MKKFVLYFFLMVSIGEILSNMIDMEMLHLFCKPLIMILLGWYYLLSVELEGRSYSLVLAMLFSFGGDTLLMVQDKNGLFFVFGLVSFLFSHVFYILAYRQHKTSGEESGLYGIQKVRFAFPIILAGTGLVVILYPALGDLKFPVMVYALVLVLMVLNALFRYGHTTNKSFVMVFVGALLFMISDSLLAVNKFLQPIAHGGLWIMLTYISAQYLIVSGLISHVFASSASGLTSGKTRR